jgi:hypothetical protein
MKTDRLNCFREAQLSHYYKAVHTPGEEKVDLTTMFLVGDAKLWWRNICEDENRPSVQTWDELAKEICEQFLPTNTIWQARDKLFWLKQTGTVREYVKEFASIMFDIKNMAKEDKI